MNATFLERYWSQEPGRVIPSFFPEGGMFLVLALRLYLSSHARVRARFVLSAQVRVLMISLYRM